MSAPARRTSADMCPLDLDESTLARFRSRNLLDPTPISRPFIPPRNLAIRIESGWMTPIPAEDM
jgi:hypothetical protein